MKIPVILALAAFVCLAAGQEGPAPPRLQIPGAIPLPARAQFRNEKLNLGPLVRVRRPLVRPAPLHALPAPIAPRILEDSKPVTEEPEDDLPEGFIPNIIQNQQQFYQEPNSIQHEIPEEPQLVHRQQQQEKPIQRIEPQSNAQRFSVNQDRPRVAVRPKQRPHFEPEPVPQVYRQQQPRPTKNIQHVHQTVQNDVRVKKPVAQILRKYREEHEDGSITWGFENDDGSFKEEKIGIDCVTKGRYGYVDPDGLRREYNYETGILCDPNKRSQNAELEQTGFVDYDGNKAVLPNGVEIDLAAMGKNKSRRPGAVLHQQQFYRN